MAKKPDEKPPGKLTAKQQAYVDARISGMNRTDAYRHAYEPKSMSDKTIWVEASRLDQNPKVAPRLEVIEKQATENAVLNRSFVINSLMSNAEKAASVGDFTASNKALELLGKVDVLRLFVERTESDNKHDHKVESVSSFDELLERASGDGAKASSEDSVLH